MWFRGTLQPKKEKGRDSSWSHYVCACACIQIKDLNYKNKNIWQHKREKNAPSCWTLKCAVTATADIVITPVTSDWAHLNYGKWCCWEWVRIFLRISNVCGTLIIDSFYFSLPLDDRKCHHLWSAASRLMQCALITWAEMLLHPFTWPLNLPPFIAAEFFWKLQSSNRKCSFHSCFIYWGHLSHMEAFHLSVSCIPSISANQMSF